jgi:peptidoglycan/LPS O-acetylase OafA/YrhL
MQRPGRRERKRAQWCSSNLNSRIVLLVALGTVSLELFLVHMLVGRIVADIAGSPSRTINSVVLVLPALAVAILAAKVLQFVARPVVNHLAGLFSPPAATDG